MTISTAEGSQTAVISTEHTLSTITTSGVYVLTVDTNAMASGDILYLRISLKVRSTGTTRLAYFASYSHEQHTPVKLSIPIPVVSEVVFTLEQTAGTGRSYPWEIVSI